ncbi:MAG: hypothetical protein AABZ12_09040 [Planctomycetota bacterium]
MPNLLAQAERMSDFQRAVRNQFQHGSSWTSVVVAIAAIGGIVVLAYFLTKAEVWAKRKPGETSSPRRLFTDVAGRLGVGNSECNWLLGLAKQRGLSHPTTLLLSASLFDEQVERWKANAADAAALAPLPADQLAKLRSTIFPHTTRAGAKSA